jgi:two-component system chemotaxis sensor kinase CheA
MDLDAMRARLLDIFRRELDDGLVSLDRDLAALEEGGDPAPALASLFRLAHSLKGAATAAQRPAIGALALRLESQFAVARGGTIRVDAAFIKHCTRLVAAIRDEAARMRQAETPAMPGLGGA